MWCDSTTRMPAPESLVVVTASLLVAPSVIDDVAESTSVVIAEAPSVPVVVAAPSETSPAPHDPTARMAEAIATYAALRDDGNPKPRLALLDAWHRQARPDDGVDLYAHALVDPDESVRERAQFLFDRAIAAVHGSTSSRHVALSAM